MDPKKTDDIPALIELTRRVFAAVVTKPDSVQIGCAHRPGMPVFTVTPAPEDAALCIGKKGVFFHSVKRLMRVAAEWRGIKFELSTVVNREHEPAPIRKFQLNRDWKRSEIEHLLLDVATAVFGKGTRIQHDGVFWSEVQNYDIIPPRQPRDDLQDEFGVVFLAIGKMHGVCLVVNVRP